MKSFQGITAIVGGILGIFLVPAGSAYAAFESGEGDFPTVGATFIGLGAFLVVTSVFLMFRLRD